jgi:hypothetical protein
MDISSYFMEFKDKYSTDINEKDKEKKVISNDAYCIGEMIEELINITKLMGSLK